jgi:hypothetical protein
MMGLTMRWYCPTLAQSPGVTAVEGDGDLRPLKVLRGGGWDRHDLPGCKFLLLPWLIRIGAPIDVVDLIVSFGEVALGFFGIFLLISPFGRLEYFICETLESIAVPSFVLSLGLENADAIQGAFKCTRPGPVLLVASWLFHHVDGMIRFPLLVVALGWARLVLTAQVLPHFYSLMSRVTSSARAYLLAMANIASDVLEFFMVSLRNRDGSLSPFLKNITIDLSSTSGMIFLLL